MAELDVQPKKGSPWWIWLLLALLILGLIYFLRGCNDAGTTETNDQDSTTAMTMTPTDGTGASWDDIDFNTPDASYDEITDTTISVRGNSDYTIYGLGEDILFATGDSTIQTKAYTQLKQIAASLDKRSKGASVAVYGNTDSTGSAGLNQTLGMKRAEEVKQWLVTNAAMKDESISVHSKGQTDPVASNATPQGRQLNRRVEIVARMPK